MAQRKYRERRTGREYHQSGPCVDLPCVKCGVLVAYKLMDSLCPVCREEFIRIGMLDGIDAATQWAKTK